MRRMNRTSARPDRKRICRAVDAIALALIALSLACGEPRAVPELPAHDPIAERMPDDSIRIRWEWATDGMAVYRGESVKEIDRSRVAASFSNGTARVEGLSSDTRFYFSLRDDRTGEEVIVAERLLPLEGTHNFRDLGGYRTQNGGRVRWGMIYRSDHLGDLTEDDLRYLHHLDIRLVCDFRGDEEVESHPDRLPEIDPPRRINPSISNPAFSPSRIRHAVQSGNEENIDFTELLIEGNRIFVRDGIAQYRALFRSLSNPEDVPLLFHCTAGKDRAGLAAALILHVLGVPRETIMADYMLSGIYSAEHIESTLRMIRFASLFRVDPETMRPLLGVQPEFIGAAYEVMREEYGSQDQYLRKGLGLSEADIENLRDRFVRPVSKRVD